MLLVSLLHWIGRRRGVCSSGLSHPCGPVLKNFNFGESWYGAWCASQRILKLAQGQPRRGATGMRSQVVPPVGLKGVWASDHVAALLENRNPILRPFLTLPGLPSVCTREWALDSRVPTQHGALTNDSYAVICHHPRQDAVHLSVPRLPEVLAICCICISLSA